MKPPLAYEAEPDREHLLRKALESRGIQVIDFNFDHKGLQTWET